MEVKNPVIFVSYSHKDEEDKKEIKKFIGSIDTNFKFDIWDDTKIQTGDIWKQKIEKAISEAHIAILLLSIDFLDSDFIKNDELPLLLEKYNKDKIIIFCVLIGYCPIDYNPFFKKLQIFNKNSPLRDLPEGEKAKQLSKLAGEIYDLCN
ncbi:toll/interleukin-1 receptor domain-containing protein, partial [uncultured Cyclobacterium sp.]|uniref:toll/interleukin-1 receptor domain-containing protein n=1 Tax=uncultured Cyclobacterium sp. TaxID=453820 RepID=UPI0030EEF3FD